MGLLMSELFLFLSPLHWKCLFFSDQWISCDFIQLLRNLTHTLNSICCFISEVMLEFFAWGGQLWNASDKGSTATRVPRQSITWCAFLFVTFFFFCQEERSQHTEAQSHDWSLKHVFDSYSLEWGKSCIHVQAWLYFLTRHPLKSLKEKK